MNGEWSSSIWNLNCRNTRWWKADSERSKARILNCVFESKSYLRRTNESVRSTCLSVRNLNSKNVLFWSWLKPKRTRDRFRTLSLSWHYSANDLQMLRTRTRTTALTNSKSINCLRRLLHWTRFSNRRTWKSSDWETNSAKRISVSLKSVRAPKKSTDLTK